MAQRYCQRGLEMENDNIEVLELTGHVMMEVGNMEAAKQVRWLFEYTLDTLSLASEKFHAFEFIR